MAGDVDYQWRKAPDFHEHAEALGIETAAIIAVNRVPSKPVELVWYSVEPEPTDAEMAWTAGVARDRDGILRVVGEPAQSPFTVHEICQVLVHQAGAADERT